MITAGIFLSVHAIVVVQVRIEEVGLQVSLAEAVRGYFLFMATRSLTFLCLVVLYELYVMLFGRCDSCHWPFECCIDSMIA